MEEKNIQQPVSNGDTNKPVSFKNRREGGWNKFLLAIIGIPVILVGIVVLCFWWVNKDNGIRLATNDKIDITPTRIQKIQDIGQWEFLSISDEELVDTVSRGFFGDSELVRIYYGTLRLGINLHHAGPHWLHVEDDTVVVASLPPIELLDKNFIDETRSKSFFENGSWKDTDREHLYQQAYKKMLKRCFTKENRAIAEENAKQQFGQFLRSMGYKNVRVEFQTPSGK